MQTVFFTWLLSASTATVLAWTSAPVVTNPMAAHRVALNSVRLPLGSRHINTLTTQYVHNRSSPSTWDLSMLSSSASTASEEDGGLDSQASDTKTAKPMASILQKVKSYFTPKSDGLTTRERLAKMGLAAVLSYGWVSNMSYSVTVSVAWYIFSSQTKKSPLAPGQWKGFLAVYAGFWVFNNIIRPVRVGVAVAISPQFDRFVLALQERWNLSKAVAVTVTVLLANLFGTILVMSAGILLASVLAGVPVFPTRA